MVGVSSNIMLGQAAPCGTGLMELQMDMDAYLHLQATWQRRHPAETWSAHVRRWEERYAEDRNTTYYAHGQVDEDAYDAAAAEEGDDGDGWASPSASSSDDDDVDGCGGGFELKV